MAKRVIKTEREGRVWLTEIDLDSVEVISGGKQTKIKATTTMEGADSCGCSCLCPIQCEGTCNCAKDDKLRAIMSADLTEQMADMTAHQEGWNEWGGGAIL